MTPPGQRAGGHDDPPSTGTLLQETQLLLEAATAALIRLQHRTPTPSDQAIEPARHTRLCPRAPARTGIRSAGPLVQLTSRRRDAVNRPARRFRTDRSCVHRAPAHTVTQPRGDAAPPSVTMGHLSGVAARRVAPHRADHTSAGPATPVIFAPDLALMDGSASSPTATPSTTRIRPETTHPKCSGRRCSAALRQFWVIELAFQGDGNTHEIPRRIWQSGPLHPETAAQPSR